MRALNDGYCGNIAHNMDIYVAVNDRHTSIQNLDQAMTIWPSLQ